METGEPTIPFYKEAFTYINVTKSPLLPVLIDGSPSKVSRGWTQTVTMFPERFSIDPDNPEERVSRVSLQKKSLCHYLITDI